MESAPKDPIFKAMGLVAAASLAAGGLMHLLGLILSHMEELRFAWWYYAIFGIASLAYPVSAVLMIIGRKEGYVFAMAGPIVGGALIALGFVFPDSQLLILIPGTYGDEIRFMGFFTLITEPVAVVLAGFCLYNQMNRRN